MPRPSPCLPRDGVLAIIITIMVLELKVPHGSDLRALKPLLPVFLSYVLSFVYLGIYWNNHHHLLKAATRMIRKKMGHSWKIARVIGWPHPLTRGNGPTRRFAWFDPPRGPSRGNLRASSPAFSFHS